MSMLIKLFDSCGTGVWSVELAREFPNSTFVGTDVTNIFATSAMTAPTNCAFFEANVLNGLQFEDNSFDFVFQRAQTSCFNMESWPGILKELMRVTKPGGYIELREYPCSLGVNLLIKSITTLGLPLKTLIY
ncbi:S-adenosyl-L-methionine-dependent methyltransferase [Endogone sp. FLAS-F59071]|nr:S-adenosyl-L-methionine-dependent methyltransferase [Endogone sp. FLAS-F59071]|eukprot:RUS19451.1 S-adenosyl-L-methionine-dependent methyltransferase [Endogone sp. FLAS-F59071]